MGTRRPPPVNRPPSPRPTEPSSPSPPQSPPGGDQQGRPSQPGPGPGRPSQLGQPPGPGRPSQPGQPPGPPGRPSQPGQPPGAPGRPSQPGQPPGPGAQGRPSQPGQPPGPGAQGRPSQPGQPPGPSRRPSQVVQPPQQPGQPPPGPTGRPSQIIHPPQQPGGPSQQGRPSQPGQPPGPTGRPSQIIHPPPQPGGQGQVVQPPPTGKSIQPPGGKPPAEPAPTAGGKQQPPTTTPAPAGKPPPPGGRQTRPTGTTNLAMTGAQAVEVENLILKFNEKLPKCKEIREKYEEQMSEENEHLLNTLKEEITRTQNFIMEQDVLLVVYESLKKFFETVDKLQEESFERQKNTLIEYLEAILETIIIGEEIKSKVKDSAESQVYNEYVNNFIKASEEQANVFEQQCQMRRVAQPGRKTGKKEDIKVRIEKLLQTYREPAGENKKDGPSFVGSTMMPQLKPSEVQKK